MAVKSIPDGYHSVTPAFIVEGAAGLIEFLSEAFGARERMRMPMPDGTVAHAELEIGDSVIMLGDATPENPPIAGSVHLYVEDVDATYRKALAAGAESTMEPEDRFWGDRQAEVRDRFGNRWSLATHVEDVSDEEMAKRMEAMMAEG